MWALIERGIPDVFYACARVHRVAERGVLQTSMDIDDFLLYAILCFSVQTPKETTPNAKVAGWTPARATIDLIK